MTCKVCSKKCAGTHCFRHKPRKPMQAKKRMKAAGKLAKAYAILREDVLKDVPDSELYCFYCVYAGNEHVYQRHEIVIEHYHSKARRPDLRFKRENLVLSCRFHNREKMSLSGDEYLARLGGQTGERHLGG